jgi:hypothetical protein
MRDKNNGRANRVSPGASPSLHLLGGEVAVSPRHRRRTQYQSKDKAKHHRDEHSEGERDESNFLQRKREEEKPQDERKISRLLTTSSQSEMMVPNVIDMTGPISGETNIAATILLAGNCN